MSSKYKKLVRDNIPDIIIKNGEKPIFRRLNKKEFKEELIKKLIEEVNEVKESVDSKEDLISELGDVQEVLTAIYEAYGIECSDVTKSSRKKRKNNGAFTKKIFLEGIK